MLRKCLFEICRSFFIVWLLAAFGMSLGVSSAMAQIPYGQGEMVSIAPIVISAQEEFAKLQAQYAAGASKDVTTSIFNLRPMPGSSTVNGVPTHWLFDGLRVWSDGRRYSWSSGLTHTSRCPRAERGASIIENTKNVRVNDVVVGFELECLLSYSKKVNPRDHVCRANDLNYFTPNPVFLPTGEKIRNDVDYQDNGQDSLTLSRSYRAWSDGGGTKFNFQPKTLVIARSAEIVRDASWITWSPGFYPQTSSYERSHYGKSIFAEYNGDGYIFSNSDGDRRTFKSNVLKMVSISEEDQPGGVATVYRLDDAEADTAEYYEEAGSTGEDAQVRKYYRIIKKRAGKSWYYFDYIDGAKIHVKNRFGRILEINHLNGRVDSVVAPDGAVYSYKYDLKQNLTSVHYPDGEVRSYHYQENTGLMTGIDINEDVYERYYYDDSGRVKRTEFSGGVGAWDIQVLNNSAFVADPVGTQRSHSFGFLGGSFSTSVSPYVHSDGNVIAAKSSGKSGLLESLRTFGSENRKITWDETRRLPLQFKLADGNAASQTKSIDWHPESRWPVRITESGPQGGQRVTELAYDSHGNLLNEKITGTGLDQPVARNWSYTDKDLLASEVDENGAAVSYTYDQWGNRKSRTNALGQVTAYVHDASGRLLGQTDPNGISHSYTYDARGRLLTQSANGLTTTMGYHPSGLLASMAVASGYRMEFNYDAAHRLTGWQDNRGNRGSYVLDGIGNRITEELRGANGGLAFTIQRTINAINRIASQKVGDDKRTSYKYDANGDLIEITNGLNQATSFTLDRLRRLTGVADPRNAKTLLAYNALDALTQAADFKGVATDYASDAQGNVKQEVSPDAGKSTASYDRRGQLVSNTDAAGRTLTVQRDALDRPTQLQYGSTATSTLRYDLPGTTYNGPGAPKASTGHLSEIQDPGVTTQYQRDILGRVLRKSQILANGDTRSLIHAYVPAGQGGAGSLQSITYPSGKQATYLYDSTGQITGLQWNGQPLVTGLAWSPLGQPTAWQWQGFAQQPGATAALAEQRSYSTAGQLASSTLLNLTWDAAGRISLIQQQHMLPGTAAAQQAKLSSAFSYDAVGRLTASAHSAPAGLSLPTGWSLADTIELSASGYAWDANGNRTQVHYSNALASGTSTLQRNYQTAVGTNRLQSYAQTLQRPGSAAQNSNVAFSYDASGALVKKGDNHLHYGADGRIAKAGEYADAADARAVSYIYNALGQRVLKSDARGAGQPATLQTLYAEDGIGSTVLGQYANQRSANSAAPAGQSDSTEIIYLPTASGPMPIAAEINGRLYAIHTDHLNTPRRLTNQQGQVAWQWLISGFGEVRPTTGDRGYGQTVSGPSYAQAVKFDLRYPGQVFDEETGLSYNLHRYYDAATGRYMQADPIGLEGGWNRFGYVNGNPLSYVDPLGLAGFVPGGGGAVDTGDMCQPLLLKNPMDDNGCLRPFVAGGPSLCVGPGSLGKAGPALGSMTKEELKALIGKDQTELLRQLFGTGIPGANNALSNLTRPEALTNQAVNAYRELATRAISQYERSGNAAAADLQRLRLEILNRLK